MWNKANSGIRTQEPGGNDLKSRAFDHFAKLAGY